MKAYLINPDSRTISTVECDGSLKEIYALLGVDLIDVCYPFPHSDDCVYVDDEGLMKPNSFFRIGRLGTRLAGRGLVMGSIDDGANGPTTLSVEDLKVMWVEILHCKDGFLTELTVKHNPVRMVWTEVEVGLEQN